MRIPIRLLGRIWLFAFLILAATTIWHYGSDISTHLSQLQQASTVNLVELLVLQLAFWGILALGWSQILRTFGTYNTPFVVCFWHQMLVMLGKYVPGKIWGIVARGGELKSGGNRLSQVVGTASLEQMLSLHSGMVVAALILPLLFPGIETVVLAAVAVLTLPIAARFSGVGLRLIGVLASRLGRETSEPVGTKIAAGRYAVLICIYGALWIIVGLIFTNLYAIFVDSHVTMKTLFALMLSSTAGIMAGFLALFAPAGIGVREGVTVGLLLPYMPAEHAVLLAVVSRLWQVTSDAVGGTLGFLLARYREHPQ